MERVVKFGTTEILESDVATMYKEGKYVCNYGGIYQIFYSPASKQYYGRKVIHHKGYAGRGRYYAHTAEQVNRVMGEDILAI